MQIVHLFLMERILGARESRGCPSSLTFSSYKGSVLGRCSRGEWGGGGSVKWEESVELGSQKQVSRVLCGQAPTGPRALPSALSRGSRQP